MRWLQHTASNTSELSLQKRFGGNQTNQLKQLVLLEGQKPRTQLRTPLPLFEQNGEKLPERSLRQEGSLSCAKVDFVS